MISTSRKFVAAGCPICKRGHEADSASLFPGYGSQPLFGNGNEQGAIGTVDMDGGET